MRRELDRFWGVPPGASLRVSSAAPRPGPHVLELRAGLLPRGPARIELPELRPVQGEPLLSALLRDGREVTLSARTDDGSVELAFDPDRAVAWLIGRRALTERRPAVARLPFHYHRIPAPVRRVLRDLLTRRRAVRLDAGFPGWPVEPSVEAVRLIYLAARRAVQPGLEPSPFWPDGKRWALLLSHDVDSAAGLALAPELASEEHERGLAACWYIVGSRYPLDPSPLGQLVAAGGEIGLHGDLHDNKLSFLSVDEIGRRLDACAEAIERYDMRGFRSPSMLRTTALYDALASRFTYDSSMPDTGLLPRPNGCASVFPVEYRGMLVLPLTVPPDGQLLSRGLTPDATLAAWIAKAEWVREVGGVAFHLTHPERGFSSAPAMRDVYRRFLDWAADQADAWRGLPVDLATAWRARLEAGVAA